MDCDETQTDGAAEADEESRVTGRLQRVAQELLADTEWGRELRDAIDNFVLATIHVVQTNCHILPHGLAEAESSLWRRTATKRVQDMIKAMKPRDPLERMLIEQCILTHGRVRHLAVLANQQESVEWSQHMHHAADKASNTYRRLMLALDQYRRPPRAGDVFTAIKQANIANQQIIQNAEASEKKEKTSNEQGCDHAEAHTTKTKALPADAGGIERPAAERRDREALAVRDRPADG